MRMSYVAAALLAAVSVTPVSAQTPPAAAPAPPPVAQAAPPPAPAPAMSAPQLGKRDACRADAAAKRLRGQDKRDQIQMCIAQGQVDCVRQASISD